MTGPPDSELVERFKAGDRRAFDEIVRRYQHRVFTLAMRWMGDEQIASEVAQDVFIALFRSLKNFRGDAQLSTWIYRVVINHCKNGRQYRRRRKMNRHEPLEGERNNDEDGPKRQIAGDGPLPSGMLRTDAQGFASIPIARPGLMTIRATYMTQPKTRRFEWASYWTSLTFQTPKP